MKVFVLTSHLEYNGAVPETYVEGVFETLEKAKEAREEVYKMQLNNNGWLDYEDEDIERKENDKVKSMYNTVNDDFVELKIWERPIE